MLASEEERAMTFEEIEFALKRVADNQVVQGELLDRLDRKLEQLADVSGDHQQGLELLVRVSESHSQQLHQLSEVSQAHERRLVGVEDQIALMVSTLNSLLQRMDAFIQGLQKGNGHAGEAP
jgi:hypothetical protein